jgi:3-oxoacyl-[acyl-carrier protein] reductase
MSQAHLLENKVFMITGSGRGIGRETALILADRGADVVINDIDTQAANEVAALVEKKGKKSHVSSHDISDYAQAHRALEEVKAKFGKLDGLVNNAGITRDSMLHKCDEKTWDEVIKVNLKGPFNAGQAAAKIMSQQNSGRIINLSSVAWEGNIGQSNYSAAKAGVVGLTRTWALELARFQITVNAIAPGLIETQLTQKIPADILQKFVQRIPLKRMGKTHDIGNLIAFLLSDQAAYITGQVITVDGGLTTGW